MEDQSILEGTDTASAMIFAGIFLVVLLLAVVVIIGVMQVANEDFAPGQPVAATNETGWLNSSGYTFDEGTKEYVVSQVIKVDSGEVLNPGNYTVSGNKIYATAGFIC